MDFEVHAGIRDFGAAQREERGEPVRFRLRGRDFTCLDPVPVGVAIAVAASSADGDIEQMSMLGRALRSILVEGDRPTWDATLLEVSDPSVLWRILSWVVVESTGRPTQEPGTSPGSSSPIGPDSTAGLPAPLSPASVSEQR